MNNIQFGIQATIIGISAVFVVLMTVSIVMMSLRRLESRILSREEDKTEQSASTGEGAVESFNTLTAGEKFLAIAAVDAYRTEQALSETETLAAIGAVLEDQQRQPADSAPADSEQNV